MGCEKFSSDEWILKCVSKINEIYKIKGLNGHSANQKILQFMICDRKPLKGNSTQPECAEMF